MTMRLIRRRAINTTLGLVIASWSLSCTPTVDPVPNGTTATTVAAPKCVSPKDGATVDASTSQTYAVLLANYLGTMRLSFVEDRAPDDEVWATTVTPGLPAGSVVQIVTPANILKAGRVYRWEVEETLPNVPGSLDCSGKVIAR